MKDTVKGSNTPPVKKPSQDKFRDSEPTESLSRIEKLFADTSEGIIRECEYFFKREKSGSF